MASLTIRTIHNKLILPINQESFQGTIDKLGDYVTVKPTNLGSSTVSLSLDKVKSVIGLDAQETVNLEDFGQQASEFSDQQVSSREQEIALLGQKDGARDATLYAVTRNVFFDQYKNVPLHQLAVISGMQEEVQALQLGNDRKASLPEILAKVPKGVNLLQPIREVRALTAGN